MSIDERISAYIDGELNAAERAEVERLLRDDAAVRSSLDRMRTANAHVREKYAASLEHPVPLSLAKAIMDVPEEHETAGVSQPEPARSGWSGFKALVASVVLLIAAGGAGYIGFQSGARQAQPVVVAKRGWLDDIADYHRVYATEGRHLVEAGPEEAAHLEAWLGRRTNTPFKVPELRNEGLEFAGGRLLVAAGRPVAQLIYKSAEGEIFALCFTNTGAPDDPVQFKATNFDDLDMVSWKKSGSSFVVVGPAGSPVIEPVAKTISDQI